MTKIPEILAPAGSFESLKAAIDAGADAVYLSGKRFGARQFAENFTPDEIEESINYAHLRGVKVYITVNTLIKERELLSAVEYLIKLYEIGADAVLIQDLGLAQLAREIVPDLTVHASTQMTIHNLDGVHWAQNMGFKRVVLSRELSLEEIKEINRSSNMELEIFLHGALCYCYSGQCLLSSFIGGRSGNRGMCAQPCRKPYQLVVGKKDQYGMPSNIQKISLKDHYLISPKDLALYSNLNLLLDSGINSLKIEGRMRSPEYVAVVVSIYRRALDQIKKGKLKPSPKELETLKLAFNRGFTPGHLLKSRGKQLMGRDKPGHRGLHLGTVQQYNPRKREVIIKLKTITQPQKGDGLFFESSSFFKDALKDDKNQGLGIDVEQDPVIKKNEAFLKVKKPVQIGSEVYLTRRHNLVKQVPPIIHESSKQDHNQFFKRSGPTLDISFKLSEENFPVLKAEIKTSEGKKISTEVRGNVAMEKARTRPISEDEIRNQLLKVGKIPFKAKIVEFEYLGDLFLPLSELNKVRRELIDKIESEILKSYRPHPENLIQSEKQLYQLRKELKNGHDRKSKKESKKDSSSIDLNTVSISSPSSPKIDPVLKEPEKFKSEFNELCGSFQLSVYIDDINSIKSALDAGFKRIYFEPLLVSDEILYKKCFSKSSVQNIKYDMDYVIESLREASKSCADSQCELIWKWPIITRSNLLNFLKEIQETIFLKNNPKAETSMNIMVGNAALAHFLKNKYDKLNLYGSSALNIWNHHSVDYLSSVFSLMTLSPELSYKDLKSLVDHLPSPKDCNLELIVQGNLEAMISEDCIISPDWLSTSQIENFTGLNNFWGLKDKKNHTFPLKVSSECQSIILNSVETCLVDQIPLIMDLGVKNLAIDSRGRGGKYIHKMSHYYQRAIYSSYNNNYNTNQKELEKIKKQIKKISQGGITAGNFLRGVEL